MTKAERTKQLIIDKSAPLFNKKGVAGTSLSDILAETKLAKGSLYVHFENKEAISHAVVDHFVMQKIALLNSTLNGPGNAKAKLFAYLDVFLNPVTPPFAGGCPFLNFGMESDDTDQVIRNKVKNVVETAQWYIAKTIKNGIAAGEFNSDWEPEVFALKLFSMMQGAVMISRVTEDKSVMKTISELIKQEITNHTI
jgi:TetR/AcrR family transcriptional regulator, transcriptional repressor for nem operon